MSSAIYAMDKDSRKLRLCINGKTINMPVDVDAKLWNQELQLFEGDFPNSHAINSYLYLSKVLTENYALNFGESGINMALDLLRQGRFKETESLFMFDRDAGRKDKVLRKRMLRHWFTEFVKDNLENSEIAWELAVGQWKADAIVKSESMYYEFEFKTTKGDYNLDFNKRSINPETNRLITKHSKIKSGDVANYFYFVLNADRINVRKMDKVDYAGYIAYKEKSGKYVFEVIKRAPQLSAKESMNDRYFLPYTEQEIDRETAEEYFSNYDRVWRNLAKSMHDSLTFARS